MAAIPASAIVSVLPGVIGAGGTGLDLSGLILTANTRVPVGALLTFTNSNDVMTYFGPGTEANMAIIYFNGYDNSTVKPAALLFAYFPSTATPAYLRGGNISGLSLTSLQAISGVITLTIDGTSVTSSSINLSSATSFTNAATIIGTALGASAVVTFDSISGAFVITSATNGAGSTITFATGSASAALRLTAATGAVTSQGAVSTNPSVIMEAIIAQTQNFVSFTTATENSATVATLFAQWANGKNSRYVFVTGTTNIVATTNSDTVTVGYLVKQAGYVGTALFYDTTFSNTAAFIMGAIASINFNATNGRSTFAFKSQTGLVPGVTNQGIAAQLILNGYNFYGAYATANQGFTFFYPGSVTGPFLWLDAYINQVWMNNGFQLALMTLLTQTPSIPYNAQGRAIIASAMQDVINKALTFGAIRPGVTLSAAQAANVNAAAGFAIDATLSDRGWYLLVQDATPQVRAARGSPPVTFWYTDGGSVQSINVASLEVQ